MKFWTTGRIDEKIEFEIFQPPMLEVEERINNFIQGKHYGNEIVSFDVVVNIFEEPGQERFKYSLKNKETEIDVNIDHDTFLRSDFNMRCELYLIAILHSISSIRKNKHLSKFNFEAFSKDLSSLIDSYKLPI
jgi:hypothetical protein